jgi:hypothetical protein
VSNAGRAGAAWATLNPPSNVPNPPALWQTLIEDSHDARAALGQEKMRRRRKPAPSRASPQPRDLQCVRDGSSQIGEGLHSLRE